ncbi:TolC family outer membrane protein [Devosia algicola]|uniref:TolC family outer membrane protein n=1 Tax=Devosia algicola TaxID=3026418 RepID=A0ABY7YPX2_9HYPH|nr:TolC family outer membrane protein [Devosia algicola]WDR03365.1 TolC family outer membrane protein [Devosia algicola]
MKIRAQVFASALAMAALGVTGVQAQSITQALTRAYQYAPDLASAELAAKVSSEGIVAAKSAKLPQLGATVSGDYSVRGVGGGFTDTQSLSAGLGYSQNIFDSNKTDSNVEAARAGAQAAEYNIRNTEQNVLLAVVQAYMAVLSGRQLVQLQSENQTFYQAQLKSARDRLDVGEGTRIDVAQAEARLAQGVATYRAAVNSLEISQATFQRYVGQKPGNLNPSHNYSRLIPRTLDAAIAEAEGGHPAILMAKAAIRAAQAGGDAAKAAFGPTVSLTGSVGMGVTDTAPTPVVSGAIGFKISVPIYAGGAIGSGVRKANLQQIKSEVDAMSSYDRVRESVISAWSGVQSADSQIQAAQSAVSAGQEVLSGVIQERDLGARTTLDVLNAQSDLTTARQSLITASSNKVIATFSLLSAIGHLTATDLGLSVTVKTAEPYTATVEDVWQELRSVSDN